MISRLLAVHAVSGCAVPRRAAEPERPRLAVVISIEQMRAAYLERFAPYFGEGGFKRFTAQGLVFTDCHHRHGITTTGPGHATILSGVHANQHGIVANDWRLREWPGLEQVNCVEDRDAPLVGLAPNPARSPGGVVEAKPGRSPRHLLASTVGDQLKLRYGARAKVFGVADKDRAAILMAGKLAAPPSCPQPAPVVTPPSSRPPLPP